MLKRILVAIDETDLSERVIQALDQIHLPTETELLFAHVIVRSSDSLDIAAERPSVDIEDVSSQSIQKLQAYQARFPYPSHFEVVTGDPAEEIVRLAYIHKSDLIIMGCRGLKGLNRVLQGSVSSQVVADSPCSVLVVKAE